MTNDTPQRSTEGTVHGTVKYDGRWYVQVDDSGQLTPVSTTTDLAEGDRVIVTIKDHTATVTGNLTSPAARTDDVRNVNTKVDTFQAVVTEQFQADSARIGELFAENVTIKADLEASSADISDLKSYNVEINEKLTANEADIKKLSTDKLDAVSADIKYATIKNLEATNADLNNLSATHAEFAEATVKDLEAHKAVIDELDSNYANIEFANVTQAAIHKLLSDSGIFKDLVVSEGQVTGELIAVHIKGDLIEAGTLKAEQLILRGEDGLYYKLNWSAKTGTPIPEQLTEEELQNGLSGSAILAKSITAEKVAVNDLVAFDATIGGFNITDKAIYSGVKESVHNSTRGSYLDTDGQVSFGDDMNYLKYYKGVSADGSDVYLLDIAANELRFGSTGKTVTDAINESSNNAYDRSVEHTNEELKGFNEWIKIDGGITLGKGDSAIQLRLENNKILFQKNGVTFGYWDGVDFHTGNIYIDVNERAQLGNFAFVPRSNHAMSFFKVSGPDCINLVKGTMNTFVVPTTETSTSYEECTKTYDLSPTISENPKDFLYGLKDGYSLVLSYDVNFQSISSSDGSLGVYYTFKLTHTNGTVINWNGSHSDLNTPTEKHTESLGVDSLIALSGSPKAYIGHYSCVTNPLEDESLADFFVNPNNYTVTCDTCVVKATNCSTTGGYISNIQLERGVEDTDWAPAPEDILEVL
jgi:hypothetical protein